MKGYDHPAKSKRRAYPKERLPLPPKAKKRRLVDGKQQAPNQVEVPNENSYMKEESEDSVSGTDKMEEIHESISPCEGEIEETPGEKTQREKAQRRNLFVAQATCAKNCFTLALQDQSLIWFSTL